MKSFVRRTSNFYLAIVSVLIIIMACFSCVTITLKEKPQPPGTSPTVASPAQTSVSSPSGINLPHKPVPTGTISVGPAVELASKSVDSQGGTITVNKPGDPLDRFNIYVPQDAYKNPTNFKISYSPITSHSFGPNFNPITPLITIDNGGGYSDELIMVDVPANVPPDSFVMGFFYNESTKTVEGMPLVTARVNSVTVATRHFSSFTVSAIANSALNALIQGDIDSGFKPGVDDWEFENKGSYIVPKGHCAGQSMSAMWYYCTQPDGPGARLYNRYDNNGQKPATPGFDLDDSLGYRLASTIQDDIKVFWEEDVREIFSTLSALKDEFTRKAFAYSMQITGEPQFVHIQSNGGGSHAMIVYRITNGNLLVADPNYPGKTDRAIELVNNVFKPYSSGVNKMEIDAGKGKTFERISYYAKTAIYDWEIIPDRWEELKDGAVGEDLFPRYDIRYLDDSGQYKPLVDGFLCTRNPISTGIMAYGNFMGKAAHDVYRDGKVLTPNDKNEYTLKSGDNLLGFHIGGNSGGAYEYVDFKYLTVRYLGLTVVPATVDWLQDTDYTFIAESASPTQKPRYDWDIDGKVAQSGASNKLVTKFTSSGVHNVTVKLFDGSGKQIGEAMSRAFPIPQVAGKLPYVNFGCSFTPGDDCNSARKTATGSSSYCTVGSGSVKSITWDGLSFSGKAVPSPGSGSTAVTEVHGTLSKAPAPGTKESIMATVSFTLTTKNEWESCPGCSPGEQMLFHSSTTSELIVKDLPITLTQASSATNLPWNYTLQTGNYNCPSGLAKYVVKYTVTESVKYIGPDWKKDRYPNSEYTFTYKDFKCQSSVLNVFFGN